MTEYENKITKKINQTLQENNIKGKAWRHRQAKYQQQHTDIFVDFKKTDWQNLAIEHKALKTSANKKLYFTKHFSNKKQLDRFYNFCKLTGRKGLLVITLRKGRGKKTETYSINWKLLKLYHERQDKKGIRLETLEDQADNSKEIIKLPLNEPTTQFQKHLEKIQEIP